MEDDSKKPDLPAGFLLGETLQVFSKEKCTQIANIYKFQNPSELYRRLTDLYSIYAIYISADRTLTASNAKKDLLEVIEAADNLSRSLRILPSFEATVFFSRLGTGKASFISKLELMSEQAEYLLAAIESDDGNKGLSLENLLVLDLIKLFESGTGTPAAYKIFDAADNNKKNINRPALEFVRACLTEAGIWKSEHLITELIQKKAL